MRILYLHPAGAFGGASKSLVELFRQLVGHGVCGTVLTPEGSAQDVFSSVGLEVQCVRGLSQLDNTRYGYYRRLRWLIVLRELLLLPFSMKALWRLRRESFDLIHINEVTLLPLGILAKKWLGIPLIVHVRSLQRKPGSGLRTRYVNALLKKYADSVVAIDHTVAGTLPDNLNVQVVHNGLSIELDAPDASVKELDTPVKVGFLGVLIPLKGVFELIEAMRVLKERGVSVECWIAGENARKLSGIKAWLLEKLGFSRDVRAELEMLIQRYSLQDQVKLLGFVRDVRSIYPQLDILCFPSHLDAAGRPVFEAAFFGVPSIVAVKDPMPDAVVHEVTGLAVPKPDPELVADAIQRLVEDTVLRQKLGAQAKEWAKETFAIENNAARMLELYRSVPDSK